MNEKLPSQPHSYEAPPSLDPERAINYGSAQLEWLATDAVGDSELAAAYIANMRNMIHHASFTVDTALEEDMTAGARLRLAEMDFLSHNLQGLTDLHHKFGLTDSQDVVTERSLHVLAEVVGDSPYDQVLSVHQLALEQARTLLEKHADDEGFDSDRHQLESEVAYYKAYRDKFSDEREHYQSQVNKLEVFGAKYLHRLDIGQRVTYNTGLKENKKYRDYCSNAAIRSHQQMNRSLDIYLTRYGTSKIV